MVISKELAMHSDSLIVDPQEVYELYEEVSSFSEIPSIRDLYGQYCMTVDVRLADIQVTAYLDDYDKLSGNVPDYMQSEISQMVGFPINMTPEELMLVLDSNNLAYWNQDLKQSPLQEVW